MNPCRIYCAMIDATLTPGEYQMGEISLCEYSEEWDGDVRGYVENIMDGDPEICGDGALGAVRQNFGGLDPVPGSILVVCSDGEPKAVYWASKTLAGWVAWA